VVETLLARAMIVHADERLGQHLPTAPSTYTFTIELRAEERSDVVSAHCKHARSRPVADRRRER